MGRESEMEIYCTVVGVGLQELMNVLFGRREMVQISECFNNPGTNPVEKEKSSKS